MVGERLSLALISVIKLRRPDDDVRIAVAIHVACGRDGVAELRESLVALS